VSVSVLLHLERSVGVGEMFNLAYYYMGVVRRNSPLPSLVNIS
jgi:hypothetical protein